MKHKFILLLLCVWYATTAHAQYEFMDKYENERGCAVTYISKDMIKGISQLPLGSKIRINSDSKLMSKLHSIRILRCENRSGASIRRDIKTFLDKHKFEKLMHLNEGDVKKVDLYKRVVKKGENEFVLYMDEGMWHISIFILTGTLDINDLNFLSQHFMQNVK